MQRSHKCREEHTDRGGRQTRTATEDRTRTRQFLFEGCHKPKHSFSHHYHCCCCWLSIKTSQGQSGSRFPGQQNKTCVKPCFRWGQWVAEAEAKTPLHHLLPSIKFNHSWLCLHTSIQRMAITTLCSLRGAPTSTLLLLKGSAFIDYVPCTSCTLHKRLHTT